MEGVMKIIRSLDHRLWP